MERCVNLNIMHAPNMSNAFICTVMYQYINFCVQLYYNNIVKKLWAILY